MWERYQTTIPLPTNLFMWEIATSPKVAFDQMAAPVPEIMDGSL
jgi:hypothetical protein